MQNNIDYGRNIESFCVVCGEAKLIGGTVGGQLLTIDTGSLMIEHEVDAHAGMIIAMDAHPIQPLICVLGVDQRASVWEISDSGVPTRVMEANLRSVHPENEHRSPPSTSVSQAIAFHPTERKFLVRAADGSVAEISFEERDYHFNWCRAFYPNGETAYVRYVDDGRSVFVCGGNGYASVFDSKDRQTAKFRYRYNHEVIHAAEQIEGTEYLLPSDSRRVIRIDLASKKPIIEGPAIVRDHLERITYNRRSGRAFASSFDRCIYEINPETCESLGVVLQTPMKCRWLVSLESDPNVLIAQCRNGALYKVNLATRAVTGVLKQTPNALWSGVARPDGSIVLAGDGSEILELRSDCYDRFKGQNHFVASWTDIACDPGVYTKRMAVDSTEGDILLARTDGRVLGWSGGHVKTIIHHPSPLRDIATDPSKGEFWTATEDGRVYRCTKDGEILATFRSPRDEPVWALAHNANRGLLGISEREGMLSVLNAETLEVIAELPEFRRTKRMRWIDDDRLWAVSLSSIRELDFRRRITLEVIPNQRNTVEDFHWSHDKRYLALVTYAQNITLYDLESLSVMHSVSFDMHYPKGIMWVPSGDNRYEFLVWGRSGVARHYRVHDGRIITLGKVNETLSSVSPQAGVTAFPEPYRI